MDNSNPEHIFSYYFHIIKNNCPECPMFHLEREVLAGASQATILGLLFFLDYINDVPVGLQSYVKIVVDAY